MVKLFYYGLSQELMGYCAKSSHKKKLKVLSNTLKTIASNQRVASMSAIQIGQTIQYFVILNRQSLKDDQWSGYSKLRPVNYKSYLNAELKDHSTESSRLWEECCSYPGLKMLIERPKSIKMAFMDEEIKDHVEEFDGFEARLLQHQLDHHMGQDYLKKTEHIEIKDETLKSKLQDECNQLLNKYKESKKLSAEPGATTPEFNKLRQFITYSIIDKLRTS